MTRRKICVVIPIFNEQETLPELCTRLGSSLELIPDFDWRVIFVNDGSSDDSLPTLLRLRAAEPRFCLLDLSRNFGHQAALSAGLTYADADLVVTMDGDLQDPPELIPALLGKWHEGFEVVYAVRRSRHEILLKRLAYSAFYRLNRIIADVNMPLDTGDFCLMDRCVVDAICSLPESKRFLRGLRTWVGFRQVGYPYDRPDRFAGTTKYPFWKLVNLAVSGFIGFSTIPLRMASWLGLLSAFLGFATLVWALSVKFLHQPAPWGWASMVASMLFIGGVQLLVLGVLGEYLGNVNEEVRRRPIVIVRSFHGPAAAKNESPALAGWSEQALR